MSDKKDKPPFISGVVEDPFGPSIRVEEHLRRYGHLPNTEYCDDKGTCLEKIPELKKTAPPKEPNNG